MNSRNLTSIIIFLLIYGLWLGEAHAQRAYKIVKLDPPTGGTQGFILAPLGDVSSPKDGVPDFAVGNPEWDNPSAAGSGHGQVHIYSGSDLSHIQTISSTVDDEAFGSVIEGLHDLDKDIDEYPDIAISILPGSGASDLLIFSGDDFTLWHTIAGWGQSVTLLGDLDGDIDEDPELGLIYQSIPPTPPIIGGEGIFTGEPTPTVFFDGSTGPSNGFGSGFFNLGDANNDGVSDFVLSANTVSSVWDGASMTEFTGSALAPTGFSFHIEPLGDIDSDGDFEFAASTLNGAAGSTSGQIHFFSIESLTSITKETDYIDLPVYQNGISFAHKFIALDDIDSDGIKDIATYTNRNCNNGDHEDNFVSLYSLADRAAGDHGFIQKYLVDEDILYHRIESLGDIDGDGLEDFGVSGREGFCNAPTEEFVVYLFLSDADTNPGCVTAERLIENRYYFGGSILEERDGRIEAGYSVDPLTSDGDVIVASNADVEYRSNTRISLQDGFRVESGGQFTANAGPGSCT